MLVREVASVKIQAVANPRHMPSPKSKYMNWMDSLRLTPGPMQRLPDFIQLMRLDRPIGIYLLLWPTLWAVWIASDGNPSYKHLFIFITGVILTRSGGCIVNDYADRNIDSHVQRTQHRPLASGRITSKEALILGLTIAMLSFLLVLFTNLYTIALSVGALLIACTYPFMKRYTHFPQAVLGAAFAWAIPMAFAAIREEVPREAWYLYLATVLWTIAYDTVYAMVDREDDLKIGVKSTAILFGELDRAMIGVLQVLTLTTLLLLGLDLKFSAVYYLSLAVAAALFVWQAWQTRYRDRDACFDAFQHNHWVGATIFAGLFLHYSLAG